MKLGAQLWSQHASWAEFRDAALAAEAGGWDSVWTWDHLLAIFGPWEQPIFEGWMVLSALASLTSRLRLGLMVGANTFRNPGLTAKVATTLDQASNGRAVVGIGGAWFEREHEAFGFETWGSGFGERLDRLDEAVMLLRRLLDGERVTHDGRFYQLRDALCAPRPVQPHLPILVGGSGPKKTLHTVAQRADAWNTSGTVDEVRAKLDTLDEHCAAVVHARADDQLPDHDPGRGRRGSVRRPGAVPGERRGERRRRAAPVRAAGGDRRGHRALPRPRVCDGHRSHAGAIRP